MKILILGGTKDSTNLIKEIKKEIKTSHILTTTTTEYGAKLAKESGSDETISKPLPKNEIIKIYQENKFNILIDATHPFAAHISQTAAEISNQLKIPFIRFERPETNFENINTENIHKVNTFKEVGEKIKELKLEKTNILHLAGANTMEEVLENLDPQYFYPRILKAKTSIEKCQKLKIPENHILFMKGVSTIKENREIIKKYNAKVMITKESGDTGGIYEKITAANQENIKIILVNRPKIKGLSEKNIVNTIDEIIDKLKTLSSE